MRVVFSEEVHTGKRCDSLFSLRTFLDVRDSELFISVCSALSSARQQQDAAGRRGAREPLLCEASWCPTSAAQIPAEVTGHKTENMAASTKMTVVLKAVKKITVQFCPFESNVGSTRMFLSVMSSHKVRSTNLNCEVISTVKHDKSEPIVEITYLDGDKLRLKGAKLNSSEMLSAFQSMCAAKEQQAKLAAAKK
ncbi:hypothetical protein PBY51_005196 [Eleginops maclovinus]|uniref:Large ribosomal subunit protein mL53 n=1 Tax=Eleginops maclovinus TaxID=56733 RepID=A0AAN8AHC0_ELEMC|nr:hypothetical protein PBY51_005196 [Eleginops maclovinus]